MSKRGFDRFLHIRKLLSQHLIDVLADIVIVYVESAEFTAALKFYWKSNIYDHELCTEAFKQFEAASQQKTDFPSNIQGHPTAEFYMAHCYHNGYGVQMNYRKASDLYTQAYSKLVNLPDKYEYAEEQFVLGYMGKQHLATTPKISYEYHPILGHIPESKKERTEPMEWLEKAAFKDHARAMYELADCYQSIFESDMDSKKRLAWYNRRRGIQVQETNEPEPNIVQAIYWYRKSIEVQKKDDPTPEKKNV